MRAIVLSGGGAKGAYQIGVWKALKKLHISYDLITGTSVGALNGALMVQGDYLKAVWLWREMSYKVIFGQDFDCNKFMCDDKIILEYAKESLKTKGMEIKGLENTLSKYLSNRKFFKSKYDYALITTHFPTLKPIIKTKKDLKKEDLKEYLIASASCFPAFKMKTIKGETYLDGGFYDNLPINQAINMGATEVIAVDLEAIGRKQKVKNKDIPITIIHPRNEIGSFLIFKKELSRRALRLGYNDTMKTYNQLDGDYFTFKKGELSKWYRQYNEKLFKSLNDLLKESEDKKIIDKLMDISIYKRLFKKEPEEVFYGMIEKLGRIFALPEEPIYTMKKYHHILKQKFLSSWVENFDAVEEQLKEIKITDLLNGQNLIHYLFYKIEQNSKMEPIAVLLPEEFLGALYLTMFIEI